MISMAKLKREAPEKIAQPEPGADRKEKEASTVPPCDGAVDCENEPLRGMKSLAIGFSLRSGDPCSIHLHADTIDGRAFLNQCLKKIMKKRPYQQMLKMYSRGDR